MLKFALKNMAIKRAKIILIVLSIVISASVALLAYNISEQVDDGFKSTAAYYDMIIGPSGSSTQLAMNTMFFTESPLGTISYEYVEELESDMRINKVVPFTMGDSFNGAKIVGTIPDFLDGKELDEGVMFGEKFEAVIGASVAKKYGLRLGSEMITSHGLSEGGHSHESTPLRVVGILLHFRRCFHIHIKFVNVIVNQFAFGKRRDDVHHLRPNRIRFPDDRAANAHGFWFDHLMVKPFANITV